MSRALEDILFRDPGPRAQALITGVGAIVAAALGAGAMWAFAPGHRHAPPHWPDRMDRPAR